MKFYNLLFLITKPIGFVMDNFFSPQNYIMMEAPLNSHKALAISIPILLCFVSIYEYIFKRPGSFAVRHVFHFLTLSRLSAWLEKVYEIAQTEIKNKNSTKTSF